MSSSDTSPRPETLPRPNRLLTQNREMRAIGVWNWTLPALATRLSDGRTQVTCPSAGVCAQVCYARAGSYTWPVVRAKHQANLAFVLDDPDGWQQAMLTELALPRFTGGWVRIHDSGDFFSDDYTRRWLAIMRARPETMFYAYTKEILRFRRLVEPEPPANFLWVYSYGGAHDAELDPQRDRVADVFPDEAAITAAGWSSQEASDLLAVLGPRLVGVPANRIPHFLSRLKGRRFSEWQAEVDTARRTRHRRRAGTHPPTRETPPTRPPRRAQRRRTRTEGQRHDDQ